MKKKKRDNMKERLTVKKSKIDRERKREIVTSAQL